MCSGVAGGVAGVTEGSMSAIQQAKVQFDTAWAQMYKIYRPLLNADDEKALVHRVSAMKGLAWNLYLQGRTDEMGRALAQERRLTRTKISALLKRSHDGVPHD